MPSSLAHPTLHRHSCISQTTMTNVPPSFNPFATHPFNNNSGLLPQPPLPNPYPRHVPSQIAIMAGQSQPSYHPPPQPSAPIHVPQAKRATAQSVPVKQPIFEPFKKERASPELKDILSKKGSSKSSWGSPKSSDSK